jgi:hypothetical protein
LPCDPIAVPEFSRLVEAMGNEPWISLHRLTVLFERDFPTRGRLRSLVERLDACPDDEAALLAEMEYTCLCLTELLELLQERKERGRSN